MTAVPPGDQWTIIAPGLAVRHTDTETLEIEPRPGGLWVNVVRPGVTVEVRGTAGRASATI